MQEQLDRALGSGGAMAYEPGERWRNNKHYLVDDNVKDGNGNNYIALMNSINKPPASNPEFWMREAGEVTITAWSNDPVGTQYYDGIVLESQSLRRHNSQECKCIQSHVKTQGNAPRQGSELWALL
jgi:hypothetical protein